MMTILALLGVLYFVGGLILTLGVRNAPEAYEDETGFNLVWCNNDPESANVACVWDMEAAPALA